MAHSAKLVANSIGKTLQHHGIEGVVFTVRCCNDCSTDATHHIMRASQFSRTELLTKIQREYIDPHAAAHEAAEKLYAEVGAALSAGDLEDCPGCR